MAAGHKLCRQLGWAQPDSVYSYAGPQHFFSCPITARNKVAPKRPNRVT
jgi:hypothetical protein